MFMSMQQAGFDLMYLVAVADGEIHPQEKEAIERYLKSSLGGVLDTNAQIRDLQKLSLAECDIRMQSAMDYLGEALKNRTQRIEFLNYLMEMIFADKVISDSEREAIYRIGKHWGIEASGILDDLERMKRRRGEIS